MTDPLKKIELFKGRHEFYFLLREGVKQPFLRTCPHPPHLFCGHYVILFIMKNVIVWMTDWLSGYCLVCLALASPAYIVASLENAAEMSSEFFCPVKMCFEFAVEANFRKSTIPEYKREYGEIENRFREHFLCFCFCFFCNFLSFSFFFCFFCSCFSFCVRFGLFFCCFVPASVFLFSFSFFLFFCVFVPASISVCVFLLFLFIFLFLFCFCFWPGSLNLYPIFREIKAKCEVSNSYSRRALFSEFSTDTFLEFGFLFFNLYLVKCCYQGPRTLW